MDEAADHALHAAFTAAPLGVGLWDDQLRYRWVNSALAEINGVPAAEHVGRTIAEVLPSMPQGVIATYRGVVESGAPVHGVVVEGETPAAPGRRRTWSISVFPTVDADGDRDGVASFVEDVTALHDATARPPASRTSSRSSGGCSTRSSSACRWASPCCGAASSATG